MSSRILAIRSYAESDASGFFPGLTCSMLQEFLEISKTRGQTETLKLFRQRIRSGQGRDRPLLSTFHF